MALYTGSRGRAIGCVLRERTYDFVSLQITLSPPPSHDPKSTSRASEAIHKIRRKEKTPKHQAEHRLTPGSRPRQQKQGTARRSRHPHLRRMRPGSRHRRIRPLRITVRVPVLRRGQPERQPRPGHVALRGRRRSRVGRAYRRGRRAHGHGRAVYLESEGGLWAWV